MTVARRLCISLAGIALVTGLVAAALPPSAGAGPVPAMFTECPAVGHDTGCRELITVGPTGVASVSTDPNQPAIDNQEDTLVGIVNQSNALVTGASLTGTDIFGFDGDGLCATSGACSSSTQYGPTGYEGPGTSFTVASGVTNSGTVNLTGGGLAPGASTYFSLEQSPFTVSGVSLSPDITLSVGSLTGTEGLSVGGQVATFTDGPSDAPPTDFTASIVWGDGTATTTGTISQAASGDPYLVMASHIYAEEGTFTPKVTVSDNAPLPLNSATASGSAAIADAAITATASSIPDQTTNNAAPPTLTLATFTDGNPTAPLSDFTATVDWGDGSAVTGGAISQSGSTFTVTGTHTYLSHGSFTISIIVTDVGGSTATVTDPVTVADSVATCGASGCSGTVTTGTQNVQISSPSTSGTILTSVDPASGAFTCGDPFRHAPQITTVTDTGLGANILFTITFANKAASGPWWDPFAVCYQSTVPFTNLFGRSVTTGLLPLCAPPRSGRAAVAPCVQSISELPFLIGNVVEKVLVPAGDPRIH